MKRPLSASNGPERTKTGSNPVKVRRSLTSLFLNVEEDNYPSSLNTRSASPPPKPPQNTPSESILSPRSENSEIRDIETYIKSLNRYIAECTPGTFFMDPITRVITETNTPKFTPLERYNNGPYANEMSVEMVMQKKKVVAGVY